ncbi:Endo-1,4-beta-xylanase Z [Dyadobacter sp. CECT 9623]|uniref:Endo-1,4-beta-xylanase Z n=1 Tax=Dyadobacter linearis TaxID=2823330 RepID=A0ABN7RH15_9BACT|nr:alpha/beta hydrolase-fold protein [Dyadobacter sp. CECT 9623]CAG5072248.1 Endo-1,4-beta-xylanase Z [Dyadobacter sp. CECT 9623]
MNKVLLQLLFLITSLSITSQAAVVDTVDTYSAAMKKNIKAVVIRPDNYASAGEMPVVYLLHGYSGNYADWVKRAPGFEKAADTFQMMIVCPDGGFGSWYWDTKDPQFQYETYVSKELVSFIDSKYKTIKDRRGRAITGLSMGGHGGLYLAFRHQDVFGAAGSMSGGVDIRPFPNNWDMAKRLGKYAENPKVWEENTVINMLHLLTPNTLSIIIDCGKEDFFFGVNENLHRELMYRNIPHDYIVRPGAHNWPYWTNAIQYQLLFMNNFFSKKEAPVK